MDVGKGREQERKLCRGAEALPREARLLITHGYANLIAHRALEAAG